MAIDVIIFTDIRKAGKRLFFIRGADLLKLFFKPLSDQLSGRVGICALNCNKVRAFLEKNGNPAYVLQTEKKTVKILYSLRLKNARDLRQQRSVFLYDFRQYLLNHAHDAADAVRNKAGVRVDGIENAIG